MLADPGPGPGQQHRRLLQVVRGGAPQLAERAVLVIGRHPAERDGLGGERGRPRGIRLEHRPGRGEPVGEHLGVHARAVHAQAVAVTVTDDRVRAVRRARTRDQDLQRLGRLAGALSSQISSVSRVALTVRPAAASAASNACGRSPTTGSPSQRTVSSSDRMIGTRQV